MPLARPAALLRALGACALAATVACAPAPGGPDAGPGPTPDAGFVEPPLATVCDEDQLQVVDSSVNPVSVDVDTGATTVAPRDMGFGCNNDEAAVFAPQKVVRYTVPGTGPKALQFSTDNEGTDPDFPTIVQVRRRCEEIPTGIMPPTCFGPTDAANLRGEGGTAAEGGDTLYFLLSGYSDAPGTLAEHGTIRLTITVRDAVKPTLSSATAALIGTRVEVTGSAGDVDGNIGGLSAAFLDAAGALIDLDGDGLSTASDELARPFLANLTGLTSYTGAIAVNGAAAFLRDAGAVKARIRAWDRSFHVSETLDVDLEELPESGVGGACGAEARCFIGLDCRGAECVAPEAATNVCAGASPLAVTPPQGGLASRKVVLGVLSTGNGAIFGSCADTPGKEAIYAVEVPAGKFDLLAQTNVEGTESDVDTVVYVRQSCADPSTEKACNDEVARGDSRSSTGVLDAATGTWFVFVEDWEGVASGTTRFNLMVTLRPVLATGEACDVTQANNRCERARCLPSTARCP